MEKELEGVGSIAETGMVSLLPLLGSEGRGGVIFIRALKGGLEFRAEVRSLLLQV